MLLRKRGTPDHELQQFGYPFCVDDSVLQVHVTERELGERSSRLFHHPHLDPAGARGITRQVRGMLSHVFGELGYLSPPCKW